jgi:asparagine synthase (glutamine-hydrolysing)
VLRSSLRGLVPDIILDRRDKIGFETPQALWLKPVIDHHRSHLDDLVRSSDIFQLGNRISHHDLDVFWRQLQSSSSRTWRVINFLKWAELLDVDTSL